MPVFHIGVLWEKKSKTKISYFLFTNLAHNNLLRRSGLHSSRRVSGHLIRQGFLQCQKRSKLLNFNAFEHSRYHLSFLCLFAWDKTKLGIPSEPLPIVRWSWKNFFGVFGAYEIRARPYSFLTFQNLVGIRTTLTLPGICTGWTRRASNQ